MLDRAAERGRVWNCGFWVISFLDGITRTLFLQQHVSLTSLLESHGHSETQALKAALGLPCLLALHICQPHPSPRPRLMNETCSPSYWSPEAISQLLSIDLVHPPPGGSSLLPLPLLQHALKFQSFFNSPSLVLPPSTYPNGLWFQ